MKPNDQSAHSKTNSLLQWMGHLIHLPLSHLTIHQILENRSLVSLLTLIDAKHFQCLQDLDSPNFLDLLILIEDYIQHILAEQFKRRLWSEILKKKQLLQLLSLITYAALRSHNKSKFIQMILQEPSHVQNCIKDVVQQTQSWMESKSFVDSKEMLNKIDDLQAENETLKEELQNCQTTITELQEKYRMLQNDYYFVENQYRSLKKQKSYICKELQLNTYDDFVQKYRLLEQDLDDAYEEIKYDQDKIKQLQTDRIDCKARIIGDGQIIGELNEQLITARGICKSLRMSTGLQSPVYKNPVILTSRTLKENIPSLNLPKRQGDDIYSHRKVLFNFLHNTEDDLEDEVYRLRSEVQELRDTNVLLNEQILSLKQINNNYKQSSDRLKFTNKERKNKLMQLQFIFKQFRQEVLSN